MLWQRFLPVAAASAAVAGNTSSTSTPQQAARFHHEPLAPYTGSSYSADPSTRPGVSPLPDTNFPIVDKTPPNKKKPKSTKQNPPEGEGGYGAPLVAGAAAFGGAVGGALTTRKLLTDKQQQEKEKQNRNNTPKQGVPQFKYDNNDDDYDLPMPVRRQDNNKTSPKASLRSQNSSSSSLNGYNGGFRSGPENGFKLRPNPILNITDDTPMVKQTPQRPSSSGEQQQTAAAAVPKKNKEKNKEGNKKTSLGLARRLTQKMSDQASFGNIGGSIKRRRQNKRGDI